MKRGFCFTGEGARGAVQAGIALALHQKGIDADFTIGISSGSCCAAAYSFVGAEGLAEMWNNVRNIFSVFGFNWNFLWNRGLLNQKPAEKTIAKIIKNKPVCEGVICRLNIMTGELQYVSNKNVSPEEFGEAALGGFAITGLVTDRNGWVDAGSRQMAPLQQCIDAGCDEIYIIMGRPPELKEFALPKGILPQLTMAMRALDVSLFEIMMRDIWDHLNQNKNIPVHIIHPKTEYYDCVLFRKCRDGVIYGTTEYEILEERALRFKF